MHRLCKHIRYSKHDPPRNGKKILRQSTYLILYSSRYAVGEIYSAINEAKISIFAILKVS